MNQTQQFPILATSICLRQGDEVLLVQRGKEPGRGSWAFPGGKVELGETTAQAALRELKEECGLVAQLGSLIGLYDLILPDFHFVIACYFASHAQGTLRTGSDALKAQWFKIDEALKLKLMASNAEALRASEDFR
jgi:8-oxo-dGTP diphosphatase